MLSDQIRRSLKPEPERLWFSSCFIQNSLIAIQPASFLSTGVTSRRTYMRYMFHAIYLKGSYIDNRCLPQGISPGTFSPISIIVASGDNMVDNLLRNHEDLPKKVHVGLRKKSYASPFPPSTERHEIICFICQGSFHRAILRNVNPGFSLRGIRTCDVPNAASKM